jgi:hypothetical protein
MQRPDELLEKQQRLNNELEEINTHLYEMVWMKNGPMERALSGSKLIARSYSEIYNSSSSSDRIQQLKANERQSVQLDQARYEKLRTEVNELEKKVSEGTSSAELLADLRLELKELEVAAYYRDQLLDSDKAPTDFDFLNMAYGSALLKDSKQPDFNAKTTSYFIYNDIFPSIQEYFLSKHVLSLGEQLILDLYSLNSKISLQRQAFQQEFAIDKMSILSLGKSAKESYYATLEQRCEVLFSIQNLSFASRPAILNPDHPILAEVISLMRLEALDELGLIYKHLLETPDHEANHLRAFFYQNYFLSPEQEARIKIFLPIPKGQQDNSKLSLKALLESTIKERTDHYQKFAQALLGFLEGKLTPNDFFAKLVEFSATRFEVTGKRETSPIGYFAHSVSTIFSGEKVDYQARYRALNEFQTTFIAQLDQFSPSITQNLPKLK